MSLAQQRFSTASTRGAHATQLTAVPSCRPVRAPFTCSSAHSQVCMHDSAGERCTSAVGAFVLILHNECSPTSFAMCLQVQALTNSTQQAGAARWVLTSAPITAASDSAVLLTKQAHSQASAPAGFKSHAPCA